MNSKEIAKIKLFAQGIKSRFNESKDFFIQGDFELISGRKTFTAQYKDSLYYNKEFLPMGFEEALDFMVQEAEKYDSFKLTYNERGAKVILLADGKNVTIKQEAMEEISPLPSSAKRDYYIKASQGKTLLQEIGIMTQDGKIKNDMIRKYNQVDHFIEVIDPMLRDLPADEEITVLDCACGKSYLTFVINYYLKEVLKKRCHFIGVDYNEGVIQASKERAKRLGYKNMTFVQGNLMEYEPNRKIHLLVSLHACDNATDFAIATGVRLEVSAMVVVPCCHKELIDQLSNEDLEPILKHQILKTRFNDVFTDGLRCVYLEAHGYEVSALEYISPLDTPKNLMIRGVKKSKNNPKTMEEFKQLKRMFRVNPVIEKL